MRTSKLILACSLLLAIACTPVLSCITSTPSSSKPGTYDITWSGCDLNNTLSSAYSNLGISSIALFNENQSFKPQTFHNINKMEFMSKIAKKFSCESGNSNDITVFCPPNWLSTGFLRMVMDETNEKNGSKFVLSLTPNQLDIHKAQDGISWSNLSEEQRSYIRYCVTTTEKSDLLLPEPELSKQLERSRAIIAIQPAVEVYHFNEDKTTTVSSFWPTEKAYADFEKQWTQGRDQQIEKAHKSYYLPRSNDDPGDSNLCELHGIYSVTQILEAIQKNSKNTITSITTDGKTADLQFVVYCNSTTSYIAQSLAVILDMDWMKKDDSWILATSPQRKIIHENYGYKPTQQYLADRSDLSTSLKLRDLMRTSKLKVIADPHWTFVNRMLAFSDITLDNLTANQKADFLIYAAKHLKYPESITDSPDSYDLRWAPRLCLYIAADNVILSSQFLPNYLPSDLPKRKVTPKH